MNVVVTDYGNYLVQDCDLAAAGISFRTVMRVSPWSGAKYPVEEANEPLNFAVLMDFLDLEAGHRIAPR